MSKSVRDVRGVMSGEPAPLSCPFTTRQERTEA